MGERERGEGEGGGQRGMRMGGGGRKGAEVFSPFSIKQLLLGIRGK